MNINYCTDSLSKYIVHISNHISFILSNNINLANTIDVEQMIEMIEEQLKRCKS